MKILDNKIILQALILLLLIPIFLSTFDFNSIPNTDNNVWVNTVETDTSSNYLTSDGKSIDYSKFVLEYEFNKGKEDEYKIKEKEQRNFNYTYTDDKKTAFYLQYDRKNIIDSLNQSATNVISKYSQNDFYKNNEKILDEIKNETLIKLNTKEKDLFNLKKVYLIKY